MPTQASAVHVKGNERQKQKKRTQKTLAPMTGRGRPEAPPGLQDCTGWVPVNA